MMDQHDAEQTLVAQACAATRPAGQLLAARAPVAINGRSAARSTGRSAPAGRAAARTETRVLARRRRACSRPVQRRDRRLRAHIGVVIARHECHVVRRAERLEPGARRRELVGERDVDEIAGDGDVVGRCAFRSATIARSTSARWMAAPLAMPVDEAEPALAAAARQDAASAAARDADRTDARERTSAISRAVCVTRTIGVRSCRSISRRGTPARRRP